MKRDKRITRHRTDASLLNTKGKQIAIIGGTGGIGRALSRHLASLGADVIVVGQTFRDSDVAGIKFIQADLSLMREAQRIAKELPVETLDMVIFTAGIFASPRRQETAEKIERDMAVSYLNRFIILRELALRLGMGRSVKQNKPRVFNMAYPGAGTTGNPSDLNAEKEYKAMGAHMNTVAANEALVLDAARRYPHISTFGLNPGLIKTNIRSNFTGGNKYLYHISEWLIGLLAPTAEQYAAHMVPLLLSAEIEAYSGAMFNRKAEAILPSAGMTESHTKLFAEASERLAARAGVVVSK